MRKLLVVIPFILLTACSNNSQSGKQINLNENNSIQQTEKEVKVAEKKEDKGENKINENQKKQNSGQLKQKVLQEIKNAKSMGDFQMMTFDCGKIKDLNLKKKCLKEKEEAKKRYWNRIEQRNQKIASFKLETCEVAIGKRYERLMKDIEKGEIDSFMLLHDLDDTSPDKLKKMSKEEKKKLLYKQMNKEINNCKLGFAFQKNICDKLKDKSLKQECKKLRSYYDLQVKLDQVKSFDVKNYINY